MNTMEQVEENLKIANDAEPNTLSEAELDITRQAKAIFEEKVKISCTDCGYCLPCPSGVNIPENFAKYNDYFLFGSPETRAMYEFNYPAFMPDQEKAAACTECGVCEEHCTQSIPIIQELKKVTDLYG